MKKFVAMSIFGLAAQSAAQGAFLCPVIYGPPLLDYQQYFQQCVYTTVTAGQELACMETYLAATPPPPFAAGLVRAFFKRGWSAVEAVHRGLISNADALAQLNRDMVDTQYAIDVKLQQLLYRCEARPCNAFGYSTVCNGF
jgi:hypothetical protein